MNNKWNKLIYKVGAPLYDRFFNSGVFFNARKRVFDNLSLSKRQKVLFVGVGTGADLEFLKGQDLEITAIDISSAMLARAIDKVDGQKNIKFLEMDAQHLLFPNGSFDMVVANLILSVVPDEHQCISEIIRVTKEKGTILIFDKFMPEGKKTSIGIRLLRPIIAVLGTDIGRNLNSILEPHMNQIYIKENLSVLFNGMYRKIILERK